MQNNMEHQELLLRTAFACMACDGDIADEEISLIKQLHEEYHLFGDIDINTELRILFEEISRDGEIFVHSYLDLLNESNFTEEEEIELLRVAVTTIQSDSVIDYNEIKFFKMIRSYLSVSDESIILHIPDIDENYLAHDNIDRKLILDSYFDNVDLSFNISLELFK